MVVPGEGLGEDEGGGADTIYDTIHDTIYVEPVLGMKVFSLAAVGRLFRC